MISVAGTYSGASSFTAAKFFADVAATKGQMMTAAGTVLRPSAMFATPEVVEWLLSQSDPSGRPLLLPSAPGASLVMNSPAPGFTGYCLLGLPIFWDANISPTGSNAQILFASMPDVLCLSTEPSLRIAPGNIQPGLDGHNLVVCLHRRRREAPQRRPGPAGGAYAASPVFA